MLCNTLYGEVLWIPVDGAQVSARLAHVWVASCTLDYSLGTVRDWTLRSHPLSTAAWELYDAG